MANQVFQKKKKKKKKKGPSLNWRERTMLARDKPHNPHPNWKNVSGCLNLD
jgi:hypothetical protein